MSRDRVDAWRFAEKTLLVCLARLIVVLWCLVAVLILRMNRWTLNALIGVGIGTVGAAVLVVGALVLQANLQKDLFYTGSDPPKWARDAIERRGR